MLNIPDKYKVEVVLSLKNFIPKELKLDQKKRIKDVVKRVVLTDQIIGEEIPSLINEEYHCEVIQFYDIELTNIKEASFIVGVYQSLIKSECVIRVHDTAKEAYSFAIKRLNQQDKTQIIIEESFITNYFNIGLPDKNCDQLLSYIDYNHISNKTDKVSFYKEIFTKAFLLTNVKAYSKVINIMDCDVWYDNKRVDRLFYYYKRIVDNRLLLTRTMINTEKVSINQQIKRDIEVLDNNKY